MDERELFDVNDVVFDIKQNTRKGLLILIAHSDAHWTLMRYYLAFKLYVCKLEQEMGIMEEPPDEQ
jgi:hypothetical protein